MKIAIISANLGGIDVWPHDHAEQIIRKEWELEYKFLTDSDIPHRPLSISPRMQSKLPKMCGWEYTPTADIIIWIDSSFKITSKYFIAWMITGIGNNDVCFMPHWQRDSIASELIVVNEVLGAKRKYFLDRYANEPMCKQVQHYLSDPTFEDKFLVEAGCFIYRVNDRTKAMLKDWFIECCKWSCQDQLSLPYVLHKHKITPKWLNATVVDCEYFKHIRHIENKEERKISL